MSRRKRPTVSAWLALATLLLLEACGGGGGGQQAKVISEALVPDGSASCDVEAKVYTGPDEHDPGGVCVVAIGFHLFDANGNELNVIEPVELLQPERTIDLQRRICRGQVGLPGIPSSSSPSLFLVPNVDRCPSGTTIPGAIGDVSLVRPPQEVSCEEFSRLQTSVAGCG